jgi:hypothetical protein
MNRAIHKFHLQTWRGVQTHIAAFVATKINRVAVQAGQIYLWTEVNVGNAVTVGDRKFRLVFTGDEYDAASPLSEYLGSAQVGDLVWHVFEVLQ